MIFWRTGFVATCVTSGFVAALLGAALLGGMASAATGEAPASRELQLSMAPAQNDVPAGLAAYRQYVSAQADLLVGMTKVLATEIRDGNLDAAQSAYAPAHRYMKRIEPVARALQALHRHMDARADAFEAKEADPNFVGFHRLEYGLFANKSTAGLSDTADRLVKDARDLRVQIKALQIAPGDLLDDAARIVDEAAARRMDGSEEAYSKTDLWDFEANMSGVQEIVTSLGPQLRAPDRVLIEATGRHFAKINILLEKHKDGCGFKTFDQLSQDDRTALKAPVTALADILSTLRGRLAAN